MMATGPEPRQTMIWAAVTAKSKSGVKLKLLPTSGSVENLRLLRDTKSGVSVALCHDKAGARNL